jgi:hypothetical protein
MTEYEIAKQYENWGVPPDWAYCVFAAVVAAAFSPGIAVAIFSLAAAVFRC